MRFTKKIISTIRVAEWRNALHDGRVVRADGMHLRSFETVVEAEDYCVSLRKHGLSAQRLTANQNKEG
jgi:hypothetical protein